MNDADNNPRFWRGSISTKEKSAIQRSVNHLLDVLAPEKSMKRSDGPDTAIGHHRTAAGCVLQGDGAAVSVSWFSDTRGEEPGELHVNVWRGVVTRRGSSSARRENATLVQHIIMLPSQQPERDCSWLNCDGKEFDTVAMAAHCTELLGEQVALAAETITKH